MQVEEIDNHLESYVAAEAAAGMDANSLKLFNICGTYQKVRPIIKFVRAMLFFRPKWQAVIDEFMAVTDGICPK